MRRTVLTAAATSRVSDTDGRACAEPVGARRDWLASGAAGLACLPPYLVWKGAPSLTDVVLAFCLAAPILAFAIGIRTGRHAGAYAVASAGTAGLVSVLAATDGVLLAVLLLLSEPAEALAQGRSREAVASVVASVCVVGSILGLVLLVPGPFTPTPLAPLAVAVLSGLRAASLLRLAAPPRLVDEPPELVALIDLTSDVLTWHDDDGRVLRAGGAPDDVLGCRPDVLLGSGFCDRVVVSDRPAWLKALSDAAHGGNDAAATVRVRLGAPQASTGRLDAAPVATMLVRARRLPAPTSFGATTLATTSPARPSSEETPVDRSPVADDRLLATVSHEIRTPLNAIIGFSELLAGDGAGSLSRERRRDYAALINDSGRHMLDVVDAFLDRSKVRAGAVTLRPEPLDLRALAERCCDIVRMSADAGRVSLVCQADDLPAMLADRRVFMQILINLLSNGIKFTPIGGRVNVSLSQKGGDVVLTVSDTGIGISSEDLGSVGEPFFQASDVQVRRIGGSGLGLSIVRGLVGLQGGRMTIESAPGQGTFVTVSFPLPVALERSAAPCLPADRVPRVQTRLSA